MPEGGERIAVACGECVIRHRAVCSKCDNIELEILDGIKYYRRFEAGQMVVCAGEDMDFVGSLVSGVANLTQVMEDGRTQMVGLLLPSDFIGRPGRQQTSYNVIATTDIVLCCFRRKPFEDLLERTPHISQRLLQMTLDELDAAREWMLVLGRKTAREKIASLLSIIARRDAAINMSQPTGRMEIDLPLSREAMADYLGLTLETVSRQVSQLKRENVIVLEGKRHIIIPDMQRLIDESGDADLIV